MKSHQVHFILIFLGFGLSLFIVIAAAKYGEWAKQMVLGGEANWMSLMFYLETVPALSLFYTTLYLFASHYEIISLDHEYEDHAMAIIILGFSGMQFLAWLLQASLTTACELRPVMSGHQGKVPTWCPQSHFRDSGNIAMIQLLGRMAVAKDISSWVMVFLSLGFVECARRRMMEAQMLLSLELGGHKTNIDAARRRNATSHERGYEMKFLGTHESNRMNATGISRAATHHYESRV